MQSPRGGRQSSIRKVGLAGLPEVPVIAGLVSAVQTMDGVADPG